MTASPIIGNQQAVEEKVTDNVVENSAPGFVTKHRAQPFFAIPRRKPKPWYSPMKREIVLNGLVKARLSHFNKLRIILI